MRPGRPTEAHAGSGPPRTDAPPPPPRAARRSGTARASALGVLSERHRRRSSSRRSSGLSMSQAPARVDSPPSRALHSPAISPTLALTLPSAHVTDARSYRAAPSSSARSSPPSPTHPASPNRKKPNPLGGAARIGTQFEPRLRRGVGVQAHAIPASRVSLASWTSLSLRWQCGPPACSARDTTHTAML